MAIICRRLNELFKYSNNQNNANENIIDGSKNR